MRKEIETLIRIKQQFKIGRTTYHFFDYAQFGPHDYQFYYMRSKVPAGVATARTMTPRELNNGLKSNKIKWVTE